MIRSSIARAVSRLVTRPVNGAIESNFNQLIKSLFANNEQGFFYDPNDLSTMFQDAAGTVPVTAAGQPVGLMLDKSKGLVLGNELVTNGSFNNGTTGWVAEYQSALSNVGGKLRITAKGANPYGVQAIYNLVVGKTYKFSFSPFVKNGSGVWVINLGNAASGHQVQYGVIGENKLNQGGTFFFTATTTVLNIALVGGVGTVVGDYADFDNISVKEIAGNPSIQTTSSMRPLLVASPQRLDFDTIDDKLITNLPSALTNCTVLRAIPNVGTQVKYNQTLPMLYEDSTPHSGLVAINRALTRTEQTRLMDELDKRAGAVGFDTTVFKMFDGTQQGFMFDPNDISTMFQDAAGTIPVTAVGQPVGLIRDKSGRNNHAYQTSSASRPILRQNATTGAYYLEFDGSDDFLQTANIDFTATDKVSLFAGVRKLSDANTGIVAETSIRAGSNPGSFVLYAPFDTAYKGYGIRSQGTTQADAITTSPNSPDSSVVSGMVGISADMAVIRINGTQGASSTGDQGTGNYGNYPLYIGRRAGTSLPFAGHIYGLIGIGKLVSDSETSTIEKELAKRTGVTLSV